MSIIIINILKILCCSVLLSILKLLSKQTNIKRICLDIHSMYINNPLSGQVVSDKSWRKKSCKMLSKCQKQSTSFSESSNNYLKKNYLNNSSIRRWPGRVLPTNTHILGQARKILNEKFVFLRDYFRDSFQAGLRACRNHYF